MNSIFISVLMLHLSNDNASHKSPGCGTEKPKKPIRDLITCDKDRETAYIIQKQLNYQLTEQIPKQE